MSQPLPSLCRPDFDSQHQPSSLNNGGDEYFDDAMDHLSAADEVDQLGTNEDDNNADLPEINTPDSNPSVIEETQFVPLEVDTQDEIEGETQALNASLSSTVDETAINVQDSDLSVIADTQFIGLEVNTQAETQVYHPPVFPIVPPATNQATSTDNSRARGEEAQDTDINFDNFINADVYTELPVKATESGKSMSFIERPTISDDQDFSKGFKYSRRPAKPPVIRPQSKVSHSAFGANTPAAATESRSAFEPDHRFEPAKPHIATKALPSQSKIDAGKLLSVPQNAASNTLSRASNHVPIHTADQKDPTQCTANVFPALDSKPIQSLHQEQTHPQFEKPSHLAARVSGHSVVEDAPSAPPLCLIPGDEPANQWPPPVLDSSHISKGKVNDVQASRQESGQHSTQHRSPLTPLSAARNGGQARRKSRGRFMPFPEVLQDLRGSPRERSAMHWHETNDSARLQLDNVSNSSFSGAVSNEKRARTAVHDLNQVPCPSLSKAGPEVSNQPCHQPARSVQYDSSSNSVHAPSAHTDPQNTTQQTRPDEERAASLPPQHSHDPEDPSAEAELIQSYALPPDELSGSRSSDFIDGEASHPRGEPCHNEEVELPQDVVGDQDRAGSELVPDAKRQINKNIPDDHGSFHEPSRVPSRAQSEARPDSRRSNQGRTLRPSSNVDFDSRFPSSSRHHAASSKVLKSSATQNSLRTAHTPKGKKYTLASYKEFLHRGESYQEVFQQYEQQQALIDAQKSKIVEMQKSDASSQQQIKALEADKATLIQNMKKFADMSSKYKTHMNEVVKAQKYLTSQAARIQKESSEIFQARTIFDKIKKAIEEAKELRVSAQNFHDVSNRNQELERANKKLSIENEKLGVDNTNLQQDNTNLKADFDAKENMKESLKNDLNQKIDDLSRETRNREQLEKQLEGQATVYRELVEQLKQLPSAMSQELRKEDGVLAEILGAGNTTCSKIEGVTSLVQEMKSVQPDTSASLVKLIEDLFARLENRDQNSDAGLASFQKATAEALKELKETLGQLCLGKDAETSYRDQISSLEKANGTLKADEAAHEREAQNLTQQLEEVRSDLADCQATLRNRENELKAAHAVPVEDPRLASQIQDLKETKEALETQVKNAKQAVLDAQNEAKSAREADAKKADHIKDIEQKLNSAMNRISKFENEKDKYIADQELKDERERQKLAQMAHEQKETTRVKHQSELENSKQRLEQEESEHAQTLQQLAELQAQLEAQTKGSTNREHERVAYLKQTKQQMEQVQQFINRAPSQKTPVVSSQELQSIKKTATDTQQMIVRALEKHSQTILTAAEEQKRIEAKVRKSGALEIEKYDIAQENISLKEKIDEMQRQRVLSGTGPQSSVNNTPAHNMLQKADDEILRSTVYQGKLQKANEMNATPRYNSNMEIPRSLRRAASLNATSSQPKKTGHVLGRITSMVTPQIQIQEKGVNTAFSGSFGETDSQQRASSSQNSWRSIKPFSTFPNLSPSGDDDPVDFVGFSHDDSANKADIKSTSSKNAARATSRPSSGVSPNVTSSRHPYRADRVAPLERKASLAQQGPSNPLPHDAMPTKSAMRKPKHASGYAAEASKVDSRVSKEETVNPPRPTLGIGNIKGVRSGAASSHTMHQSGTQHSSVDVLQQGSPPAAPVGRFGQKRPHDGLGSSSTPKRHITTERTKLRTRSREIPDSQNKRKTL
ncbi:hypothetical protein DL98DRAFT_648094 [Cadophora sp. DSE1049]|nr:hypothetical protein DL98DRAFT_648094 [Cadophora sp. DSE1049]